MKKKSKKSANTGGFRFAQQQFAHCEDQTSDFRFQILFNHGFRGFSRII